MPKTPDPNSSGADAHIEEHQEIQQILGRPPGALLRWGMTIVLLSILLLLALAAWIPFPDTLRCQVVLETPKVLARVKAPAQGLISQLMVAEGDSVKTGQLLAVYDNAAHFEDIKALDKWLDQVVESPNMGKLSPPPPGLQLGVVQNFYADLWIEWQRMDYWQTNDDTPQRLAALSQQKQRFFELQKDIQQQATTLSEEVSIAKKNYEEYRLLLAKNFASAVETEAAQKEWLRARREWERIQTEEKINQLNIDKLEAESAQIQHNAHREKERDLQAFLSQTKRLKGAISQWIQQFTIVAPQPGRIVFTHKSTQRGYFEQGEELFAIYPGPTALIAIGQMPQTRVGAIQIGSRAALRFEAFPFMQHGEIVGQLKQIAPLADEQGQYRIVIELEKEGITSIGRSIDLKTDMRAEALITLSSRTALQRLFERLQWMAAAQ